MSGRSDIERVIEDQRQKPGGLSERFYVSDFAVQIATIFEQVREEKNLSYQDLADLAGTSKAHVIRLLSGTYDGISNRSIAKLCKALDVRLRIQKRPAAAQAPRRVQTAAALHDAGRHATPVFARTTRRAVGEVSAATLQRTR